MNDATQQLKTPTWRTKRPRLQKQLNKLQKQQQAAPETPSEPATEAAPAAETAPEPTPTEPRELAKPTGEFDWDAFESEQDDYAPKSASVSRTCTSQA